jgi:hypothetical protein
MVGSKERRLVDTEGMRSMMEQLPLEQRLEASVSLITFAVAEFGKVVLALGRQCNTLKSNQQRMLDAVAGIVPTTKLNSSATTRRSRAKR